MFDTLTTLPRTQVKGGLWKMFAALLLLALAVAAALPTQEFSNGGENLVVTTALETRRTGHWLVPTMDGLPRINKPPLPMWIAALSISDATMAGINSRDPAVRHHAYSILSYQARWQGIAACVLALLAAYEIAVTVSNGNRTLGWIAAAAGASTLYITHNARHVTTDVQIMLWVAVANLCFAKWLFAGWRWRAAIGAGAAMGLSIMSKGPVGLLQCAVPVILFAIGDAVVSRFRPDWRPARPKRATWPLVVVTIAMTLAVAAPWYVAVLIRHWAVKDVWWGEMMHASDPDFEPDSVFTYLVFIPWLAPWVVFFIGGLVAVVLDVLGRSAVMADETDPARRNRWVRGMILSAMLVIVPILVMTCFKDRKDRYVLPMVIAASLVIARGVIEYLTARRQGQNVRWVGLLHWLTVAAMTVGLAIAGATHKLLRADGSPWFTPTLSACAAVGFALVLAISIYLEQQRRRGLVLATVVLMTAWQLLFFYGYQRGDGSSPLSEMADRIWETAPDAVVVTSGKKKEPIPPDLPIYLNRPVQWAKSFDELSPDRPWVVIVKQRKTAPVPVPPPGWTDISTVKRDPHFWHAFYRPAWAGG